MTTPGRYVHITGCGIDRVINEQGLEWTLDRHAHAHRKGIDGISAWCPGLEITETDEPEVEAGA